MAPKDPPKDRDQRNTILPPAKVREQIASRNPPRDDLTPVGAPASELAPDRPVNSRATVGDLDNLRAEVKDWVDADQRQHDDIKEEITRLRDGQDKTNDSIAETAKSISTLNLETSKQSLNLEALVKKADLDEKTAAALELEKKKLDLRAGADSKRQAKGFWWWAARGALGVAFAAATAAITHLIEGC